MKLFKNINLDKLRSGLGKTRNKFLNSISEAISGKPYIDEEMLDKLEEILVTSDIGYDTSLEIIEKARTVIRKEGYKSGDTVFDIIKKELITRLEVCNTDRKGLEEKVQDKKPFVILIVGVNGSGKTTSVGKLAYNFKQAGLKVIVGAADTFRAAANEQLEVWAKKADVPLIQRQTGADPSSVAFDTVNEAIKTDADIVLIDTAGRLHTKTNLMEELKKIKKVISKKVPDAPHETVLVVDGNAGQNVLYQAREFSKFTELTGLIITKLDGTAKGGIVFQVCSEHDIPIYYIGVGEKIDDLQTFDTDNYVEALFLEN